MSEKMETEFLTMRHATKSESQLSQDISWMLRFLKNLIFPQFCWEKSSKISHLIDVVKALGIIESI